MDVSSTVGVIVGNKVGVGMSVIVFSRVGDAVFPGSTGASVSLSMELASVGKGVGDSVSKDPSVGASVEPFALVGESVGNSVSKDSSVGDEVLRSLSEWPALLLGAGVLRLEWPALLLGAGVLRSLSTE
jgi:hypothetical protein